MINLYENRLLKRISSKLFSINPNVCYSQNGEDVIVNLLREAKKIKNQSSTKLVYKNF